MTPLAADELTRVLCASFAGLAGTAAAVEELTSRSWASATFSGERHRLVLRLQGDNAAAAADGFLDGLSEREFELDGHILADIALVGAERAGIPVRLILEALTVEES